MTDVTEVDALKASLRGARNAASALGEIATRVDAVDAHQTDVSDADLDALQHLTLANAIVIDSVGVSSPPPDPDHWIDSTITSVKLNT